jgi:hypothetical protein
MNFVRPDEYRIERKKTRSSQRGYVILPHYSKHIVNTSIKWIEKMNVERFSKKPTDWGTNTLQFTNT